MTLNQLIAIWRGRWQIIALSVLLTGMIAFAGSLALTKKYTPTAALLVDTRGADALGGTPDRSQSANLSIIATQVDVISSERVARQVVAKLALASRAELHQQWLEGGQGHGDEQNYIAQLLLKDLSVKFNRDSNVVNVSYTSTDVKLATAIANAFAEIAVETNLQLRVEPARQFATWFDQRTASLRKALEAAQVRLSEYQRSKGLIATAGGGQIDIETAKLTQLTEQLLALRSTGSETNSRQAQARNSAGTSPDVLNNPSIAALRTEVSKGEVNLEQLESMLGAQHPQVIAARSAIAGLKIQVEREMQNVVRSLGANNAVSQRREAELAQQVEKQRSRVLALGRGTTEVTVLQRDVENAQRALEVAASRQAQTALEAQLQQGNVYLLTPAVEPSKPSSPKVLLNTVTALAFGLLIGLGLALWNESRAPIVRSAVGLSLALDLPIMAIIPGSESNRPRRSMRLVTNPFGGQR